MAEPLRVALLGYGLAGRVVHRPPLLSVPDLVISHVVTSDAGRRQQAAQDLPEAALVASADELWQRADEVDVVVVATGGAVHVEQASAALELGKAVVVDKPVALTADEASGLVALARRLGVPLSAFHNRRWDSDTRTAQQLLGSGRLGTVHRLESRFTRFRPQVQQRWREQAGSGGVLLDLGTHLVDQALLLLGPAVSVSADVAALRTGATVDDDAFLALRHASGATSLLWCSAAAPWPGARIVLQGSRAGWSKQDLDRQEDAARRGAPPAPEPDGTLWDEDGAHPEPSLPGDWAAFYRGFARAVRGDGPVPVEPDDAVAVLRVLEAARRSAETGETARLPDVGTARRPPS